MKKKEFIAQLENVSALIEYIFENDWIEDEINQIEFSELLKNVSYYKIDEIRDYLEALVRLEEK